MKLFGPFSAPLLTAADGKDPLKSISIICVITTPSSDFSILAPPVFWKALVAPFWGGFSAKSTDSLATMWIDDPPSETR